MNLSGIEKVKGFMPKHEGYALFNWAEKFSDIGPIFENFLAQLNKALPSCLGIKPFTLSISLPLIYTYP